MESIPPPPEPTLRRTLTVALVTTVVVTAISYVAPERHSATLVGLAFLSATWWLVLRDHEQVIRRYGLSLGGLLEPIPLDGARLAKDCARAVGWTLLLSALIFPLFWLGYRFYWHASIPFVLRAPRSIVDEVAGQLLVVALPEEAFFRGYLQTSLDAAWPPRWRVLGQKLGPGWIVAALIFAIGHLLTTPNPARLAVFFPALLFGWLRQRTGGIGAGVLFHACCNLFSAALARGYGLSP
jgi:hypothetical protein